MRTKHTSVIEHAPVYKVSYDLLCQVIQLTANVSKNVANPLGLHLKDLAYKLCFDIKMLYDVSDAEHLIDEALSYCSEIKLILQVFKDLREISLNAFALASERIVSVSRQLSALRGKVKA